MRAGGQTFRNRWNFWSFPHHAMLKSPSINVVSDVRWSGLRRVYPFIHERGDEIDPNALLITPELDANALEFLKNGGRVWLMADAVGFHRSGDATFFPPSGGALGSVILDSAALRGFPQDGMFDLQFFNLLQGAWNFPLDAWPHELQPIAGAIRTTSSFLSKSKKLSRTGYIFEARVGKGKLLVSTLRIRENFDESYPEAMFLFDRLIRYATGNEFNPGVAVSGKQIQKLVVK
jgi:beta-galactosidase